MIIFNSFIKLTILKEAVSLKRSVFPFGSMLIASWWLQFKFHIFCFSEFSSNGHPALFWMQTAECSPMCKTKLWRGKKPFAIFIVFFLFQFVFEVVEVKGDWPFLGFLNLAIVHIINPIWLMLLLSSSPMFLKAIVCRCDLTINFVSVFQRMFFFVCVSTKMWNLARKIFVEIVRENVVYGSHFRWRKWMQNHFWRRFSCFRTAFFTLEYDQYL